MLNYKGKFCFPLFHTIKKENYMNDFILELKNNNVGKIEENVSIKTLTTY